MLELKGKYNSCKVFTDNIDNETISQLTNLLNQEFVSGSKIRIQPDTHAGRGCVIGTTMTLHDKVVPNLVGVDIGCVDKDTEFLSIDGWHRISDYNNEEIAVYDLETDSTYFSLPNAFIKNQETEFYHLKTKYGIDQMLSKEHRCLVRRGNQNKPVSRDLPYVLTAQEIYEKHNRVKIGFRDNFICDIPNINNRGLALSDEELRIIVMYSADGNTSHTSNLLSCSFKKERKIVRCKLLLKNANIQFKEVVHDDITTITFRFDYDFKDLSCLYGLTKQQLSVICDEVMYWDGNLDSMQYTSTLKKNADFIQYAFACNGYRTNIDIDTRDGKYKNGACYRVSVSSSRPRVQLAGAPKTPITIEPSIDGFKYCFNTDTGFWIMRRNNCICITGNCGMKAIKLVEKHLDLPNLDSVIHKYVPAGFEIHEEAIATSGVADILAPINVDKAFKSLGTLGGGNHFIEIDIDKNGDYWLVIHTGSRHLGIEVCDYYQNLAYENLKLKEHNGKTIQELSRELVDEYTKAGRKKEISKALTKLRSNYKATHVTVPFELAYLEGQAMQDYLHDMKLAQEHAKINRETIAKQILKYAKLTEVESFDTIHNYIDISNMILRKGSISAQDGEKVIIPMNMRDGSLICVGKGNKDWNYSAPHGAGRILSRSKAKDTISMTEYQESMKGIYTTSVNRGTVDESPMVYKPIEEIMENIKDTVDIIDIIKPVYNFKAGENS